MFVDGVPNWSKFDVFVPPYPKPDDGAAKKDATKYNIPRIVDTVKLM